MNHLYSDIPRKGTVVALGSFDGLHIGHMAVINAAKNIAAHTGSNPCICTFSEHPLKVLTGQAPPALFEGAVKDEAFRELGVDVFKLDFLSIRDMSPEEFFNEILIKKLNARGVCCGFNYTFGAKGAGNPEIMNRLCENEGIIFSESEPTLLDGLPVSSTRIREALAEGNVELAGRMLGRPFSFRQQVVHGDERGRTWDIPTINQLYPSKLVAPRKGVYASRCTVDGQSYIGATNIGVRPTVEDGEPVSSETYLLDYDGDLYGKFVDISLLRFIRPEKKFSGFPELEDQIKSDISVIRKFNESSAF